MGYKIGSLRAAICRLTPATVPLRCQSAVVTDTGFTWGDDAPPRTLGHDTVIYEAHVKALTPCTPGSIGGCAARYLGAGLGSGDRASADAGRDRGGTCCPCRPFSTTAFWWRGACATTGAITRWLFCARAALYGARRPVGVSDHGAPPAYGGHRGDSGCGLQPHRRRRRDGARRCVIGASTTASYYRLATAGGIYVNDTGTGNTLNLTHPMVLRMVMDSLRYWVEGWARRRLSL